MVYCYKENCANRSKRKSKYNNRKGEPLFKCLVSDIIITNYCPGDEESYSETKVCECLNFALKDVEKYKYLSEGRK